MVLQGRDAIRQGQIPKRSPHRIRPISLATRSLSSGSHRSIFLVNLPKSFYASPMQPHIGRHWLALFSSAREVGLERSTAGAVSKGLPNDRRGVDWYSGTPC